MSDEVALGEFLVRPGKRVRIRELDTAYVPPAIRKFSRSHQKDRAEEFVQKNTERLAKAQDLLYANDVYSLLIIIQAMDAAGKDGLIKHVMTGLNPQGCQVFSFKAPSAEELDHNFLWRCSKCLPERGRIGIFNRSYYEETLIVRVHPGILESQRLPPGSRGHKFWKARFDDINNFEKHLVRNGTAIVKLFLNVSKKEQKKRFLERLSEPEKYWKFQAGDLKERAFWNDYMDAYEDMLQNTSTRRAPWHVIPADNKWIARAIASAIIVDAIDRLKLRPLTISAERRRELAEARKQLEKS